MEPGVTRMKFFRYRSTRCFFLENSRARILAFDAGWPCTLYEYKRMMKTLGLRFEDIEWAIVSHMHMDHAGLLGDFQREGIRCFVFGGQAEGVDDMERIILKNEEYRAYLPMDRGALIRTDPGAFNALAAGFGLAIEVLETPGHSPDSISVLTQDHEALIGDLAHPDQIMDDDVAAHESWRLLRDRGARLVYPSHADCFEL